MSQRIIDRSYVGEVLQQLYQSDLNISIALISNGGYFYAEAGAKRLPLQGTTIEEAVTALATRLSKEFPASQFSSWWMDNFQEESR